MATFILPQAKADPTQDLHKYLLAMDMPYYQDFDLEKIKAFVAQGADVHAIGRTGGNAVSIAIESWAYASTDPMKAEKIFTIVKYFIELGADVSSADYRGLSPLYTVLRYGVNNSSAQPMIDLILSQKPDLNVVSTELGVYGNWGLVHLLSTGSREKDLFQLLDLGLKLTTITSNGVHFAHRAALKVPQAGTELLLKRLMDRLSPQEQKYFAHLPASNGTTPLHESAWRKNLAAIKYLVETFEVDVNAKTVAGETALSIAIELKDQATIDYLKSKGATSEPISNKIQCGKANIGPLNFERVVEMVKTCKVNSVDELLPILPFDYRSSYVWAYATQAAIDASPDFPQVIMFGRDGKLMMTFNGHPTQKGFNNIEIMQFRDETKTFELRDIHFAANGTPTISEANPPKCMGCHGVSPRPLWDTWTF